MFEEIPIKASFRCSVQDLPHLNITVGKLYWTLETKNSDKRNSYPYSHKIIEFRQGRQVSRHLWLRIPSSSGQPYGL
uniref:MATH domain-containing protein n=1 Tax=Steinernema glaseri TaxID=37863 RepID=A0A1I8ASZ7_9BILA